MLDKDDDYNREHRMDINYWIEAADPKHRYGHLLKPYYAKWLQSGTHERFFNWLDEGKGRHLDLKESPRSKLATSHVKYFTESERLEYEVSFEEDEDGEVILCWMRSSSDGDHDAGDPIDTPVLKCPWLYRAGMPTKYIYVVDLKYRLFVHEKKSGYFHHSSFLSGHAVHAAGGIAISDGVLVAINGSSGHYKPTPNMLETAFGYFEDAYGLDHSSFIMAYPRTRKLLGPCMPALPSNFPW